MQVDARASNIYLWFVVFLQGKGVRTRASRRWKGGGALTETLGVVANVDLSFTVGFH